MDSRRRRVPGGRLSLGELVRRPIVQLVLVVTAGAQVLAVQTRGVQDPTEDRVVTMIRSAQSSIVELEPAVVVPDSTVQRAWMAKALEREAHRLAAENRTKGYSVSPQLAKQIAEAALEYEIDLEVAFGLVRAESSFRNVATSRVGAVGLTQLMPNTAAWMQPGVTRTQLRDPETNLRIGFQYLRYLLDKYEGDEKLALIAYNRGPGTVDKAIRRGRNPDNGYADFVYGKANHGHRLFTR